MHLERLVADSKEFTAAFQEMLLREAPQGGFARVRSVTPTRDFVDRAVRTTQGDDDDQPPSPRPREVATPGSFGKAYDVDSGPPMFGSGMQVGTSPSGPSSSPAVRSLPQLTLQEALHAATPHRSSASEARENSPCFGRMSARRGSSPHSSPQYDDPELAHNRLRSSMPSRTNGTTRGRPPATDRGRAPHAAALTRSRRADHGDDSHSSSPLVSAKDNPLILESPPSIPFVTPKKPSLADEAKAKAKALVPMGIPLLKLPAAKSPEKPASDAPAKAGGTGPEGKGKGKGKGMKGPPPPPKGAPPPKAKAYSQTKAQDAGWFSGRPMYWREVAGAGDASDSIFALQTNFSGGDNGVLDWDECFDWEEWDHLFVAREDNATPRRRESSLSPPPGPGITVLSHRQATSCSIILHKVGDLSSFSSHLKELDLDKLTEEEDVRRLRELVDILEDAQVKRLRELSAEVANCKASGKEVPMVRAVESRLLPLFDIDRVGARLRLAHINCTLRVHCEHFMATTAAMTAAALEVKGSKALKDFMSAAVSLRAYAQRGPTGLKDAGAASRVLELRSLISGMRDFKAVAPAAQKLSLLMFFARSLLRLRPDFDLDLVRELPGLHLVAGGVSPWPGLHDDWKQLQADSAFTKSEMGQSAGSYGEEGAKQLQDLVQRAEEAAKKASDELTSAASALEDLSRYFGIRSANQTQAGSDQANIPRKDPAGLTVLCELAELLTGFRRAFDEVREQAKEQQAKEQQLKDQISPRTPRNGQSGDAVQRRSSLMDFMFATKSNAGDEAALQRRHTVKM